MSDELIAAVQEDAAERMKKAVAHAKSEFAGVRTGRATPALVEKLPVEYYGSTVPMQQLASFSVPEYTSLPVTSPCPRVGLDGTWATDSTSMISDATPATRT